MHNQTLLATELSTPVRRKQRGTHDRATVNTILDEGLVCHVGFVHEGMPIVLPTAYVRIGDHVYLHGAPANRMFNALASGADGCLTVTLVDALVLAKTAGHHSLNYRSVTLFGKGRRVTDRAELAAAFRGIVEATLPGRYQRTHAAAEIDFTATLVIAFPIEEGAAKVRDLQPTDEPETAVDFVGVVPVTQQVERATAVPDSPMPMPHLSAIFRVRDHEVDALRAVLGQAFGWGPRGDLIVRDRISRYRRAEPSGWFGVHAQRDAQSAPELAAGGGCLTFGEIAYLGLVGVLPAFQRRGIGRILMERLMRYADARGAQTLLLDASAAGAPLYLSMGFMTTDETWVFSSEATASPANGASSSPRVRAATAADREAILALDRQAYGADRTRLLDACLTDGRALVHEQGGFCIAQDAYIGPLVAAQKDAAAELLDAALALPFSRPPEVLTRASQPFMPQLLAARGLRHARSLKHMQKGGALRPPRPLLCSPQSLATG